MSIEPATRAASLAIRGRLARSAHPARERGVAEQDDELDQPTLGEAEDRQGPLRLLRRACASRFRNLRARGCDEEDERLRAWHILKDEAVGNIRFSHPSRASAAPVLIDRTAGFPEKSGHPEPDPIVRAHRSHQRSTARRLTQRALPQPRSSSHRAVDGLFAAPGSPRFAPAASARGRLVAEPAGAQDQEHRPRAPATRRSRLHRCSPTRSLALAAQVAARCPAHQYVARAASRRERYTVEPVRTSTRRRRARRTRAATSSGVPHARPYRIFATSRLDGGPLLQLLQQIRGRSRRARPR